MNQTSLIELIDSLSLTVQELNNRIVKIESQILGINLDPQVWKFLTERIDKIEGTIMRSLSVEAYLKLLDRIENIEHFFSGKLENPIYQAISLRTENFDDRICRIEEIIKPVLSSLEAKTVTLSDEMVI